MVTVFASEIQDVIWHRMNVLAALSDDSGLIVFANDNVTALYGYLPGELIGKTVDDLAPAGSQTDHRRHRIAYNRRPTEQTMGERPVFKAMKKDGELFGVRIHLIPCVIRGTPLTIAKVYPMDDATPGAPDG